MSPSDLEIGMHLTNTGTGSIPLYDSPDGTGTVALSIAPGSVIGQIVDFSTGPAGVTVAFTSQSIYNTGTTTDKIVNWVLNLFPDMAFTASPALMANYNDIAANVDDAQIKTQAAALGSAVKQGASIANVVKQTLQDIVTTTTDTAQGLFGSWSVWEIGAVGLFTFMILNSKAFIKPR